MLGKTCSLFTDPREMVPAEVRHSGRKSSGASHYGYSCRFSTSRRATASIQVFAFSWCPLWLAALTLYIIISDPFGLVHRSERCVDNCCISERIATVVKDRSAMSPDPCGKPRRVLKQCVAGYAVPSRGPKAPFSEPLV